MNKSEFPLAAPPNPLPRPHPPMRTTENVGGAATTPGTRYTVDGDAGLERHLARTCADIASAVRGMVPARSLEMILLGGGYGRGEGGVMHTRGGDRPYNDLEFYVFMRGNRHLNESRHAKALHVLGQILTPQAGVDVEFKITSLRELATSPVSMFSYDLLRGHRQLWGDPSLLDACAHHRIEASIPVCEGTRLLMNRCSGLLLAKERLGRKRFTAEDADFVARNVAKAQLGAGDAVVTVFRNYHWSVTQRHRRLERLVRTERAAWLHDVLRYHALGVEFKLHPQRSVASREELAVLHDEVSDLCRDVWLWIENRRLGARFRSIRSYAENRGDKWPYGSRIRNLLASTKVFGPRALLLEGATRHPRNRVLNALPLLLWQSDTATMPGALARLQRDLRTSASDFAGLVSAYRARWEKLS